MILYAVTNALSQGANNAHGSACLGNSIEAHLYKRVGISLNSRMMGMAIKWYIQYVVETGQQL
jgi:hypothetical protein